jgi:AcrR family transcriptional regulator
MASMTDRPYHHGHLRAALLDEAERTLRERGVEGLSLRELARQVGVSHAAPRRHFPEREALLDALAETGFVRLGEEVRVAIDAAGEDVPAQLQAVATVYVGFAIRDAALLELMFSNKAVGRAATREQASRLFAAFGELISRGQEAGVLPSGDPDRLSLLVIATMQGIAALVSSGRIPAEQGDALIGDAIALLTRGQV